MFPLTVILALLVSVAAALFSASPKVGNSHFSAKSFTAASGRSPNLLSARQVFVNFDLDVLGIAQALSGTVSAAMNREAFVKNLAYTAFYKAGAKYNVMVFNLRVLHEARFVGVKSYGSAEYHGTIYGFWVFESGSFMTYGGCSAINWAFLRCSHCNGAHVSLDCDGDD